MAHDNTSTLNQAAVSPLRKQQPDGSPYCRPTEIEALLAVLVHLPPQELAGRAGIEDGNDPRYLPSECLVYFVRRLNVASGDASLNALFMALRQRLLRAVPVPTRRLPGSTTKQAENSRDLDVRDAVLDRFQELLCADRRQYDDRLDFYECRFNRALSLLRATARRDTEQEGHEPLDSESEPNVPSPTVEAALARLRSVPDPSEDDFLFRSKLQVAISTLLPDERRVVELLLQEFPIGSTDRGVVTIASILGCDERTVRNRRDRAFARLRVILAEEGT